MTDYQKKKKASINNAYLEFSNNSVIIVVIFATFLPTIQWESVQPVVETVKLRQGFQLTVEDLK